MKLYGAPLSPFVARVLLAVRAKGLDIAACEPPGGSIKSAEFLAINPFGKMPVLEVEPGVHILESEVICEFLEERFPEPPLLPADPVTRARSRCISRAVDLYVQPGFAGLVGQINPATRDGALVATKLAEVAKGLDGVERLLSGPWAVGERMTLADCALIPNLFFLERFLPMFEADPFTGRPALAAVWGTAKADPLVQTLMAEMARSLDLFMKQRAAPSPANSNT